LSVADIRPSNPNGCTQPRLDIAVSTGGSAAVAVSAREQRTSADWHNTAAGLGHKPAFARPMQSKVYFFHGSSVRDSMMGGLKSEVQHLAAR